jgi:FkbM family methyltransferase
MAQPVYLRAGGVDGVVLEEVFVNEVYREASRSLVGNVERIVDLGANIGLSVRYWILHFPNAQIVAVEPSTKNCELLRRNVGVTGEVERVRLLSSCVAGKPGSVWLDLSQEACSYQMASCSSGSWMEEVGAKTVAQILDEAGFEGAIDLQKCDIEGAEREVFDDCRAWISRIRNIVVELHPPYSLGSLMEAIRRSGGDFVVSWTGGTGGNPVVLLHNQRL